MVTAREGGGESKKTRKKQRDSVAVIVSQLIVLCDFYKSRKLNPNKIKTRQIPWFETAVHSYIFTFTHSSSLIYFCCFLSLWTDRWDKKNQPGGPDLWPLISNLGSSAGLLRVATWVDLTSTPTESPGNCQLLLDSHSSQWAWEKRQRRGDVEEGLSYLQK